MSLDYSIIIDKGEQHENYIHHIFIDLFSGPNSAFSRFIEKTKGDCYTFTEVPTREIIHNATYKHNNMAESKEWIKTDPKYTVILALTTHISKLEKKKIFCPYNSSRRRK